MEWGDLTQGGWPAGRLAGWPGQLAQLAGPGGSPGGGAAKASRWRAWADRRPAQRWGSPGSRAADRPGDSPGSRHSGWLSSWSAAPSVVSVHKNSQPYYAWGMCGFDVFDVDEFGELPWVRFVLACGEAWPYLSQAASGCFLGGERPSVGTDIGRSGQLAQGPGWQPARQVAGRP